MRKILFTLFVALSITTFSVGIIHAASSQNASMQVCAYVIIPAEISATNMNFGSWEGDEATAEATISVKVESGLPYIVTLNEGVFYDGTFRRVGNIAASNSLPYLLLKGSGVSGAGDEWGNCPYNCSGAQGTGVAQIANGASQDMTVLGYLFPDSVLQPSGYYSDTVLVTVHY